MRTSPTPANASPSTYSSKYGITLARNGFGFGAQVNGPDANGDNNNWAVVGMSYLSGNQLYSRNGGNFANGNLRSILPTPFGTTADMATIGFISENYRLMTGTVLREGNDGFRGTSAAYFYFNKFLDQREHTKLYTLYKETLGDGLGLPTATNSIPTYNVSYVAVAGGGGGGSTWGGGGGAGGYKSDVASFRLGTTYSFVIGGGGTNIVNGTNTVITSVNSFNLTLSGGGAGGSYPGNGRGNNGGSGGGGAMILSNTIGGNGLIGQGNNGGDGGGDGAFTNNTASGAGGGAGNVGGSVIVNFTSNTITVPSGGNGLQNSLSGTPVYLAGGGAGASTGLPFAPWTFIDTAVGGLGGGGNKTIINGTLNTGGGGYGRGGSGGSGIIIISIPTINYTGITTGSPTVVINGSNTVLIYNSSGSYTA